MYISKFFVIRQGIGIDPLAIIRVGKRASRLAVLIGRRAVECIVACGTVVQTPTRAER